MDADVTLIASGVHIIPERYLSYVEDVGQPAKTKILEIINKYEKSGVLLLSGDVHWAQYFHAGCTSFTGGYDLHEICSSGMTHVLSNNTWPGIKDLMEGHTPPIFKVTLIHSK
jgi:hypothetical protein